MALYWKSFTDMLIALLKRPMWLLLIMVLCLMSLVYVHHTVRDLPIAVVDQDHSITSYRLIRQLDANPKMDMIGYDNVADAISDIHHRKLFAVIVIPLEFERKILRNESTTISAYGDATNRLANGLLQQDMTAAYRAMLLAYHQDSLHYRGFSETQIRWILSPIQPETMLLFNPGLNFPAITFPGILVMLFQQSLMVTSANVSLALHKKPGGRPPPIVFWGSVTALLPIWLFLSIVFFALWPWILGYRQLATIPAILCMMLPFLFAVVGLSKLIVESLYKIEMVYLTLSFLTTPVYFLAGTVWSSDAMPGWVRVVSYLLPSTWAVKMIAGVNQMGLKLSDVSMNMVILIILGCLYMMAGLFVGGLRRGNIRQMLYKMRHK